jgi:hypothetical protein
MLRDAPFAGKVDQAKPRGLDPVQPGLMPVTLRLSVAWEQARTVMQIPGIWETRERTMRLDIRLPQKIPLAMD